MSRFPLPRWTPAFFKRVQGVLTSISSLLVGGAFVQLPILPGWGLFIGCAVVYFFFDGISQWIEGRQEGRIEAQQRLEAPVQAP